MATITSGITINTSDTIDGAGGASGNKNLNDLVNLATIANVGAGGTDLSATIIQTGVTVGSITGSAAAGVAALRKLGTGANDACKGNDDRLSDVRTANALKFGTNTAIALHTVQPVAGQVLHYNGSVIAAQAPGVTAWVTGNGTVDTAATAMTADTAGSFNVLQVGYIVRLNSDDALVSSVSVKTSGAAVTLRDDLGTNSNLPWEYQVAPLVRPFNSLSGVGTGDSPVTLTASDSGLLVVCDTSGGNIVVNLPAVSTFGVNSITVQKNTDDANTVTVTPDGSDTIEAQTSVVLRRYGTSLTVVGDEVSKWMTVAKCLPFLSSVNSGVAQRYAYGNFSGSTISTVVDSFAAVTSASGVQFKLHSSFQPLAVGSVVRCHGLLAGGSTTNGTIVLIVCAGTTVIGTASVTVPNDNAKNRIVIPFDFYWSWSGSAPFDIQLRLGVSGTTFLVNGDGSSATAPFGGAIGATCFVIEELL